MSAVTSSGRMVTVRCPGCGQTRELTARQARRAGRCSMCRSGMNLDPVPTIGHLRFWLHRLDDDELADLLSKLTEQPYLPSRVAQVRLALLGQEDARPARLLSSVPQQAGLVA